MDMYGMSAPECFPIDDLLDFSNDDLFSATMDSDLPSSDNNHNNANASSSASATAYYNAPNPNHSIDYFADDLCVPCDDVAELEWLSNFVDDSLNNFPANEYTGMANFRPDASFHGRSRSKRSRAPCASNGWTAVPENDSPMVVKPKVKREISLNSVDRSSPSSSDSSQAVRRCTHCASEKTPQWRTGPMGPKTLCNACGVRYKSGRLVPEYRPAASPTFVLTQHSNSHRKVMELRRQKEMGGGGGGGRQEQQQHHHQLFHHHNFEVC